MNGIALLCGLLIAFTVTEADLFAKYNNCKGGCDKCPRQRFYEVENMYFEGQLMNQYGPWPYCYCVK